MYNIPRWDYLKYYSLLACIPNEIKFALKNEQINVQTNETFFNKLKKIKQVNKYMYKHQKSRDENVQTIQQQRWNQEFENENLNWKNIFQTPYMCTVSSKLRNFQYKYLMRIVATNKMLIKFKLVSSNLCDFCSMEIETVNHLFWTCINAQTFWLHNKNEYFNNRNININLDLLKITFGLQTQCRYTSVIHFVILSAKYYIYINKCRKTIPHLEGFKMYLSKCIEIDKQIAFKNDTLQQHYEKWSLFDINH